MIPITMECFRFEIEPQITGDDLTLFGAGGNSEPVEAIEFSPLFY